MPSRDAHRSSAPNIALEAEEQSRPRGYTHIKRQIDIVVALACIIIASPLFALIAILVRLDSPGPILFHQSRVGLGGRIFTIVKFRTLTVIEDGPNIVQVGEDDPRMTNLGRMLRRCCLDELPQLFNVLWGDMSLVGPRPHALAHHIYYGTRIASYAARHAVKPGLTGWAQVHGACGPTPLLSDMRARVELDLWYIAHATIALDLLILAKTPLQILRGRH